MQVEWDVSPCPLLCTLCTSSPMWDVHTDPSVLVSILLLSRGKRWGGHSCITLLSPATHTAFLSPLMLESHHIPQHWRFYKPCPAPLRWYNSQGMLQAPGGRIDPQCHDLTLHSATQQYGCIQDPVWERTRRATSHIGHMCLAGPATLRHKEALQGLKLDPVERTLDCQERYLCFPPILF